MLTLKRILFIICCAGLFAVPVADAAAATKSTAASTSSSSTSSSSSKTETSITQSVTQGYAAATPLEPGEIVQLNDKSPAEVQPLTLANVAQMQGVVVAQNDATVTLSNDSNENQVYVATFGQYDVLVSNQNGPIVPGDYITASSLAGVGMKVDTTESVVLGKAAAGFSGSSGVESTAKLKTAGGGTITVSLGRIPVDISISHNPLQQTVDKGVPGFLQKAAQNLADKQVGSSRIYIGLVILLVTATIAGGMLYSGIRGGLIAIGRNPLAKKSVIGGIFRVVLSGLIVFIIGLFGVYLVLKL
jgi:hypothetical protein